MLEEKKRKTQNGYSTNGGLVHPGSSRILTSVDTDNHCVKVLLIACKKFGEAFEM